MTGIERIILIDDNESDNVFHEIIIKAAGFAGELLVFDGGVKALDYLQTADLERPTRVFLDINMPGMDGFEVARHATPLLQGKPAVVLLMLTSSASPQDRERAAAISIIQGYLTKPLTVDGVRELLAAPV